MKFTLAPVIVFLVVELSGALPVVKHQTEEPKHEGKAADTPEETAQISPHKFDPYDPHIRTALEEERRKKLELLRQYHNRKRELENGMNSNPFKHHEVDPAKLHAGEIAELENSMNKLTEELAEIDHQRRELFKQYEMQKQFDEEQKEMGNGRMDEEQRKQFHAAQEKLKEKHKKHKPLHHPGSKQQLEEVYEQQDEVEQDFDPKTFFELHDLDSNGGWDQDEVRSLFVKELEKMYQEGLPQADLHERREEMERMREHIFKETDTNKDGFIDFPEFLKQTKEPEFQKDDGWKGLDEQQIYTEEDYQNYLKEHELIQQQAAEANAYRAAHGVPPHPNAGNYYQVPSPQQQHGDPNLQYHQGQVPHPVQYQNQMPSQQQQYQGHQQMAGQHQQQQMPSYQHQQPPQYQQVPAQQQHYQVPQQQQQYQVPLQNAPYNQIPSEQQIYQHQDHPSIQQQQPQQQQQQNVQQQQNINNNELNDRIPPVVENVQNDTAAQQQQPSLQQSPNSIEPEKTHAAPAVVSKNNHV